MIYLKKTLDNNNKEMKFHNFQVRNHWVDDYGIIHSGSYDELEYKILDFIHSGDNNIIVEGAVDDILFSVIIDVLDEKEGSISVLGNLPLDIEDILMDKMRYLLGVLFKECDIEIEKN